MNREATPRIAALSSVAAHIIKRLPHAVALGLVAAAAVPLAGMGCSTSSSSSNDLGVSSILLIKRQTTVVYNGNVTVDVAGGNNQVIDYQRYVPGGSLNILSPARPDGTLTNLTADFKTADFNGADVSFDAKQVTFSMKTDGNDHYHIYTVDLATGPDGKYLVHQKTAGNYDDIDPIFMPGNRIAFVTNEPYTEMGTRADEYDHSRVVTQIATIDIDAGDPSRHLFANNLSHTVSLYSLYDGRIGYSRWEHLGGVNDVKLFKALPDGTNMIAIAGQHGKPSNSLFNVKEVSPNVYVGIATDRDRTIHAGALVLIDARNQNDAFCMSGARDTTGHTCGDEEHVQYTILTPDVPTGRDASPAGRYREPSVLPDGRILTSWADGPVNDVNEQSLTPPDFGVYVYDPATHSNLLVYNDRQTWDLNAVAIAPRPTPPVVSDVQHLPDSATPGTLGSVNVTLTSLDESISGAQFTGTPLSQALQGAVAVRVIEGFSSEAAPGVTRFGLTMDEGAAVLGTATVRADGSWLANVPAFIPIHVQPIDKFGLSIRNQRLWIQANPGETRRCGGCHESRTGLGQLAAGANPTVAEQLGAENFTESIPNRAEYPWDLKVQPIFDAKCVSCHNSATTTYYQVTRTDTLTGLSTTYNVPYLDLSSTPVTVYYDKQVHAYPASYVSLYYPAAMMMAGPGSKITVTGTVPPKWMIPEDARNSAAIERLNLHAADGTTAWDVNSPLSWTSAVYGAGTHAFHPEDKGITLTDDERQELVRTADLGGQYYSRQNTGFVPLAAAANPVAPGTTQY